ncbi:ATP-grasp domain-containing protein [Streptomyces sp.]|uniref:ATP-grasp domain-containing protein n=1 Tax=Streptomyces sp. TaxID=1931 RepID=UPI002F3FB420
MSDRTPAPARPEAFILLGGFGVVCRNPLYLSELTRRGLTVLLITPETWREEAEAALAQESHPAAVVAEVAFVRGALNRENSFTADVIGAARAWRERYTLTGVYAVGEVLVEQTGLLADALDLASPGLRATRVCRSKYLQRFYAPDLGPASLVVPAGKREAVDAENVRYPAVVKPASRHSSSGVVTVAGPAALRELLSGYPDHENLLVEEKVVGQEFSVETLVQAGRPVFASVTRKETTESHAHTFVELAHSVPSDRTGAHAELLQANRQLLEILDFQDGVAHAEWRVDEQGRCRLMEIAARTPGDGLLALYHLSTGVPLEPEIIRVALREPASYPAPARHTRQVYLEHPVGTLEDVTLDWPGVTPAWVGEEGVWPELTPGAAGDPPALRAVVVLKDRGSELGPLLSSDDRAVTFLVDAPDPAGLDAIEKRVRDALTLHVRPATAR